MPAASSTTCQTCTISEKVNAAKINASVIAPVCVATNIARRETRSVMTPAIGEIINARDRRGEADNAQREFPSR